MVLEGHKNGTSLIESSPRMTPLEKKHRFFLISKQFWWAHHQWFTDSSDSSRRKNINDIPTGFIRTRFYQRYTIVMCAKTCCVYYRFITNVEGLPCHLWNADQPPVRKFPDNPEYSKTIKLCNIGKMSDHTRPRFSTSPQPSWQTCKLT